MTEGKGEAGDGRSIVSMRDLRFSYARSGAADAPFELRIAELEVEPGTRWAVHGPSGCGKSTFLDLVAGAQVVSSGLLRVAGAEPAKLSEAERRAHRIRRLGFVFQDFPLVDYLSILDNVLLPFRLTRALELDADARERAGSLLDRLGLGTKGGRRPEYLSQGERQRVAVARALVTRPALVLADEPTAGLDPGGTTRVLELLEDLCVSSGTTLILVSHDPAVLERFELRLDLGAASASVSPSGPSLS